MVDFTRKRKKLQPVTMATASTDDIEEMIKCPRCFEIYNIPKYLPCLHTLCERCLREEITMFRIFRNKLVFFQCPVCRSDVHVPVSNAYTSTENIAARIPVNHLIVTLLDQWKMKSKDRPCDPCSELEKQNAAAFWCTVCNEALCTNCVDFHKAMKISKTHGICPLEEMTNKTNTITTLEFCMQHEEEKVKMYCMDHEQPCCAICVTVYHRKCEHVQTLNDAAKGIHESPEVKELTECLERMTGDLSKVLCDRKSNLQLLDKDKRQYQKEITGMMQDIKKHLDTLEEKMNQDLDRKYKESSKIIKKDIVEIESHLKVMKNYQKVLDTSLTNVSDIHLFLEMSKIKQQHKERSVLLKKRLEEIKAHRIKLRLKNSWANLTTIGTVTSTFSSLDWESGKFGEEWKAISTRCQSSSEICSFTIGKSLSDGIFLTDGEMLFVDSQDRKIIFCTVEGDVQKELSVPGTPWSIAQINETEAVIGLVEKPSILYLDLENRALKDVMAARINILYGTIGFYGTNLIFGGCDSNIYKTDLTRGTIETVASGYDTWYITCNEQRIYLTTDEQLVCLDMNGFQIFSYTNISGARGISIDKGGKIYCCDYSSNKIHQLTPDGKFISLLPTNVEKPQSIAFNKTGDRFVIAHNDNIVTVYELQK